MAETATCREVVRRIPVDYSGPREDAAHNMLCGRPIAENGVCATHLRKRKPRRPWARLRNVIGWY